MSDHKFKIGDTAFLEGSPNVPRKLPERNGECEYQIKSAREPHRVVRESQLSATR
jgi:hypothetical protein